MKRLLFAAAAVFLAAVSSPVFAQTLRTEQIEIESAALGRTLQMFVCIPAEYASFPERRYSVLYDFPGGGTSAHSADLCDDWSEIIDNMLMDPFIVISVEGNVGEIGGNVKWTIDGGVWTNSETAGMWEDFVLDEVIPYMDTSYRTLADPEHRVTYGGSGGGFPAVYYVLKRPDVFKNGLSQVGIMHDLSFCAGNPFYESDFREFVLSESGAPPYTYTPYGTVSSQMFNMAARFSPNVNSEPYHVDLPYDQNGNVITEVCDRWMQHSPSALVSGLDENADVYFNFGIYTEDLLAPIYDMTEILIDSLDAYGVPYDTQYQPCGHGVECPDGDVYTLFREEHWNVNNMIQRGAFSVSRDPAPLVAPKKEYLSFGSVPSQSRITQRLFNYGPGVATVQLSSDEAAFELDPAEVVIQEDGFADVSIIANPDRSGPYFGTITLIHEGVGIKSFSTYAHVLSIPRAEELPEFISRFDVYPVPGGNQVSVDVELDSPSAVAIDMVDMLGRRVAEVAVDSRNPAGTLTYTLDTDRLANGIYFLRARFGETISVRRVIITR